MTGVFSLCPLRMFLNYFNFMHNYIYYTGWWLGFGNYCHVNGVVIQGMSDICVMAHMHKETYMQIDLAFKE